MKIRVLSVGALALIVGAGAAAGGAGAARSAGSAVPSAISPPAISGSATEGQVLTSGPGKWNGALPLRYAYQWRRCGPTGGGCESIAGATQNTYELGSADVGHSLRVRVIATDSGGSGRSVSVPTGVVAAGSTPPTTTTTTTTTTPPPSASGCPAGQGAVNVSQLSLPTRLLIDEFTSSPQVVPSGVTVLTLRVRVSDTCGQLVGGALVYVTATPYNQFSIAPEATTGSDGWATLTMQRLSGFPVSSRQGLLALFIRARKGGENILAGISARELVSIRVSLH